MTRVTIIATGEELLNGTTVNTNSAFISRGLAGLDFEIVSHVTVGDAASAIRDAAARALRDSDIVLVTGGLGPTDDDNTVEALCLLTGMGKRVDRDAYDRMKSVFTQMGRTVSELDVKMAEIIDGSIVIKNTKGLAPGFIVETGEKCIAAMPGVPAEMETMFTEGVLPSLIARYSPVEKRCLRIKIVGMKESDINAMINASPVLSGAGTWGITVSSGISTVSFFQKTGCGFDAAGLESESKRIFGESMLSPGSSSPEEDILKLLMQLNLTIATAESCTGGLISKRLTDVPGSSAVFRGGATVYSNESKTAVLGVPEALISAHGAVSLEVAEAMAKGARSKFNADASVSTTGVAGPDGGTPEKPVGTVCFGFVLGDACFSEKKIFSGDRKQVRERAAIYASDRMRRYILARNREIDKK